MRWLIFCSLALCQFVATIAGADPVEIALPDLIGDYDSGFVPPNPAPSTRTQSFTIPAEVTSIGDLQLVLSGTGEDGALIMVREVGGTTVRDTLPVSNQLRMVLTAPTLDGGCFWGFVPLTSPTVVEVSGPVQSCDHVDPLDFDLLLGTTVQAELFCYFPPADEVYLDTSSTLTAVHLVVNAQEVAGERQTWGRIKVLYRR
jgi:hypothetical protein